MRPCLGRFGMGSDGDHYNHAGQHPNWMRRPEKNAWPRDMTKITTVKLYNFRCIIRTFLVIICSFFFVVHPNASSIQMSVVGQYNGVTNASKTIFMNGRYGRLPWAFSIHSQYLVREREREMRKRIDSLHIVIYVRKWK